MQLYVQLRQLGRVPLQGRQVEAMISDIVGGARVGADHVHGQHFQLLHRPPLAGDDLRYVATGAVLREQRTTLGGQRFVDHA
ncbi:hypothetical protein D3C78_1773830 [compost metagenome]